METMTQTVPVTHSILDANALMAEVWQDYALAAPVTSTLFRYGLNDHYLITTCGGDYILRAYHHGWRSNDDISYELMTLVHLRERDAPVCAPITRRDGSYYRYISAPEGPRAIVLFPYAEGHIPNADNEEEYRAYGRALATIHRHTDGYTCTAKRFTLDLAHLIDTPLVSLLPFLRHRPDDVAFVQAVAHAVRSGLAERTDTLEWGFCHGDFHGGNAHVDSSGVVRVFDFDCCGPGWRAYDLAVCLWGGGHSETAWAAFCRGYEEVCTIPESTREVIPWFAVAREFWLLGLHTGTGAYKSGAWFLDDGYFDYRLGSLRKLIDQRLPDLSALLGHTQTAAIVE